MTAAPAKGKYQRVGIDRGAQGGLTLIRSKPWTVSDTTNSPAPAAASDGRAGKYEEDAIYQEGKIVARVLEPEVRDNAHEVHFAEIYSSDDLMLPEECEFQKYRLMVQRVEYASRIDKQAPDKGRILRGVVAEILGYREQ